MGRKWTLEQKIERRQRRLDKRRREELPLFAAAGDMVLSSVAPLPTTEQIEQQYQRWEQEFAARQGRMERFRQQMREQWHRARELAGRYITSEQIEHIDGHIWRVFPPDPVYGADHWSHLLADLLGLDYTVIVQRLSAATDGAKVAG
jgi:hypothetical protein